MSKFRKKPVVIDAVQYNGSNKDEIISFVGEAAKFQSAVGSSADGEGYPQAYSKLTISTLEGEMLVSENDWVIKGVKGEFYPCKPEIFAATYDAAD
jgi:hypothetical protein